MRIGVRTLEIAKELDESALILVLFADSGRSYLSKFYDDNYMLELGFLERDAPSPTIEEVLSAKKTEEPKVPDLITIASNQKVGEAIDLMQQYGISQLPVVRDGELESLTDVIGSLQDRALLDRITRRLPPGAELVTAGARAGTTAQMIRAFQWNLTALSLLALVVGMFLIYNTVMFSVIQRRQVHGFVSGAHLHGAVVIDRPTALVQLGAAAGYRMWVTSRDEEKGRLAGTVLLVTALRSLADGLESCGAAPDLVTRAASETRILRELGAGRRTEGEAHIGAQSGRLATRRRCAHER